MSHAVALLPTSSNPHFHMSSNGEIRGVGSPHTEANIKKGMKGKFCLGVVNLSHQTSPGLVYVMR